MEHSFLGGAELQRCGKGLLSAVALATEVSFGSSAPLFGRPVSIACPG